MIVRAAALAITALFVSGCSTADATPRDPANPDFICTLSHPARNVSSLKKLPASVRAALTKDGAMADRGEFFNAGDAVTRPGPFNRFIRGGEVKDSGGDHWFVWYEHGGFAYWKQIRLFKINAKGEAHENAEQHGSGDLCADTDKLLTSAEKAGL